MTVVPEVDSPGHNNAIIMSAVLLILGVALISNGVMGV